MAELARYTAQSTGDKQKFTIDRNCSRILVKRISGVSVVGGLASAAQERLTANIRTHSNNVEEVIRLQVLLAHASAYSSLINKEALYELYVNGGQQQTMSDRSIDVSGLNANGGYITYFYIDLTAKDSTTGMAPAVSITSDDDFTVLIEGMVNGATYVIYGVEEVQAGSTILQYESVNNITGQKLRAINVDHLDALVLPCTTHIQKLKLHYGVGEPIEYTLEELKLLNAQIVRDEIYQYAGDQVAPVVVSPLVSELLVLMTHNVVSVDLYTDGKQFEFTQIRNRARGAA